MPSSAGHHPAVASQSKRQAESIVFDQGCAGRLVSYRTLTVIDMAPGTLLEHLRSLGSVGCDTLDVQGEFPCVRIPPAQAILLTSLRMSVAEKLGPFTDCTSNQVG